MKGYSHEFTEEEKTSLAFAREESVDASYKDLTQVCARIAGKSVTWAIEFLAKASKGDIPVLFKKFNKNLGHRHELGGQKGRYPKKAAHAIFKTLKSAAANARVKGLDENDLKVTHASANLKTVFPRMQAKGRRFRANYSVSRIEIILKGTPSLDKKIEVKKPEKKEEAAKHETKHPVESGQQHQHAHQEAKTEKKEQIKTNTGVSTHTEPKKEKTVKKEDMKEDNKENKK